VDREISEEPDQESVEAKDKESGAEHETGEPAEPADEAQQPASETQA
jgi:hypothetical protein